MPYKDPEEYKEYHKKYSKINRDKFKTYSRTYKLTHPGRVKENKRRMRNLRNNVVGWHTNKDWDVLKIQYGYTCPSCKISEPKIKLTEDHIIPISKGGSDYIENIQPLCHRCNSSKGNRVNTQFSI